MSTQVLRGRYRLDEVVDSGATATVWRATDLRLDRTVAVKLLNRRGVDPAEEPRFRDEARALARLSHPNIVAVFDSGTDDEAAFLVMELVEGRTVRSRLDDGPLPVAEAAALMAQVCDALTAAHEGGVVHRDIKPGNIVVTPGGIAKLCDFGIARLEGTAALTASHVALGTASYMAPEQILGRTVDGRADLYAVGCVLFELLTGKPPFAGQDAFGVAYQHLHAEAPHLGSRRAGVPSALDALVRSLLAKEPDQRPASAAQVRLELMRHATPVSASVGASANVPRRFRLARAGLAKAGLAAVAAIAVPVVVVFAAWPRPQAIPPPVAGGSADPATSQAVPAGDRVSVPRGAGAPTATTSAVRPATPDPTPSAATAPNPPPPAATPTPLEQVAALQAVVRQLTEAGDLAARDAAQLDRMLNDVADRIAQGRTREIQGKITEVRARNDGLLSAGKITAAGHEVIDSRLVRLSAAVG